MQIRVLGRRVCAVAVLLLFWSACGALAKADAPSAGLTTALLLGSHDESSGATRVPLLPIPVLDIHVPFNRFEFAAEGVPPIGPVPYGPGGAGFSRATKLSYGFAALRYHINQTFTIGIGETLYNQDTIYGDDTTYHGSIGINGQRYPYTSVLTQTEIDSSRVPGARYEVQGRWPLAPSRWVYASLALTPKMHAIVGTVDSFSSSMTTNAPIVVRPFSYSSHFSEPETASEVDASIGVSHRTGPTTLSFGIRYLNYIARFNRTGSLADRNTLVLPFLQFERALGH